MNNNNKCKDPDRLKGKGKGKIEQTLSHANPAYKRAVVTVLILDKLRLQDKEYYQREPENSSDKEVVSSEKHISYKCTQ